MSARPHLDHWFHDGPRDLGHVCVWCGATREAWEDALVSQVCATADPIGRALAEAHDAATTAATRHRDDAKRARAKAEAYDNEAAIAHATADTFWAGMSAEQQALAARYWTD